MVDCLIMATVDDDNAGTGVLPPWGTFNVPERFGVPVVVVRT